MNLLRLEQRKLAAKTVIDKVNGRIPVFVHIGAVRTEDTMELARHAYAADVYKRQVHHHTAF